MYGIMAQITQEIQKIPEGATLVATWRIFIKKRGVKCHSLTCLLNGL
jgi:hypothetical protein